MIILYKTTGRVEAENTPEKMYIFTDNIARSSGSIPIEKESRYYKKYGPGDLKRPYLYTTAVLRGLDNAYPLTIQKYCKVNGSYSLGAWDDTDYDLFKKTIDDDFKEIYKNLYKYDTIVLPLGGLFNRENSRITLERTPKIYNYLDIQLNKLLYNK